MLVVLLGSCFGQPAVAPCHDPQLWYSPLDDAEFVWACEPPQGWLPTPPEVEAVGPRIGLGPFPAATADTGLGVAARRPVPVLDTGEALPPVPTGLPSDTGRFDSGDTGGVEVDTADTFFVEDTGLATGLTGDTAGVEDTLTTADTGVPPIDTFATADTGIP
ncbi:MAG: hypothetical protein KTR31_17845 [Myxococcales bacterium]|nr:hypothetical protein [Myxococcales bacterium]